MNRLDADSPRAHFPESVVCADQPYPHQLSALYHMRLLERSYATNEQLVLDESRSFVTSVGFLCDPPGAGKTLTTLLHLTTSEGPVPTPLCVRSCMHGCVNITTHTIGHIIELDTDLVIVPRGTLRQWSACLDKISVANERKCLVKSTLTEDNCTAILRGDYGLVITAESGARSLCDSREYHMVRFRRLVMDEADSIRIPTFCPPHAHFRWFVTATPRGYACIVELRTFLSARADVDLLNAVTIASTPEFVHSSLQLPTYTERLVQVRRSQLNTFLRTLLPDGVMNALEANDPRTAVQMLGLDSVSNEDNLVRAVMDKHKKEIEGLERIFATASINLLPGIEARIREAQRAVVNIEERIRSADCCPIGLCDLTPDCVRAVVPCCHNVFLFVNIVTALQRQQVCPLCKSGLDPCKLVVINPQDAPPVEPIVIAPQLPDQQMHPTTIKAFEEVLKHIYTENPVARVLVFSDYDMHDYDRVLGTMGVRCGELKGNTGHIANTIQRFESGDLLALTVSVRHFGAGLNLQMADHIIAVHRLSPSQYTQLVGRSQRPGRRSALTVWRLQYSDGVVN